MYKNNTRKSKKRIHFILYGKLVFHKLVNMFIYVYLRGYKTLHLTFNINIQYDDLP